jgi:hypothetical protein
MENSTPTVCSVPRTHQGKCHQREGIQKPYLESATEKEALRKHNTFSNGSEDCPRKESKGQPYKAYTPYGLSCKWVTGPGGFNYERCDNYQSYQDSDPHGNIGDPMATEYPVMKIDLEPRFKKAEPLEHSETMTMAEESSVFTETSGSAKAKKTGPSPNVFSILMMSLLVFGILVILAKSRKSI